MLEKIYAFLLPSFWFTVFLFYLFEVSRLIFLRHLLEIESSRHNIAVRFTLCLWQELIWRCCSFIKMMENSFQGDHNLRKVMCGELFKEIISKIHVIRTRLNFPWTEIENRHRFQSCHTTWITIQDQRRESYLGTENSKTVLKKPICNSVNVIYKYITRHPTLLVELNSVNFPWSLI